MRTCDRCGNPSKPLVARKRVGDELLCGSCTTLAALGSLYENEKLGHQSLEDDLDVFHCPFCGSGQVTGRADGDIICDFCEKSFIVSVQPMVSELPQTIDGEEYEPPSEEEVEAEEEAKKESSFYLAAKSSGVNTVMDEESYLRYLAVKHADDRRAVIGAVRASRRR